MHTQACESANAHAKSNTYAHAHWKPCILFLIPHCYRTRSVDPHDILGIAQAHRNAPRTHKYIHGQYTQEAVQHLCPLCMVARSINFQAP
eukprot:4041815-Pleurochrysis_carterae.AAC.2